MEMIDKYLHMPAPAFSNFRETLEKWDHYCLKENIEDFLDKNQMIFFFKRGDDVFGTPEDGRLIFAKLKSDEDDSFRDEAQFMAMNLLKSLSGDPVQSMFGHKDLDTIKVCDREDAVKLVMSPPKTKSRAASRRNPEK